MDKPPLYRRVNTTAHLCRAQQGGGDHRDARNAKSERDREAVRQPMHGKTRRGRDYTPLYRFLIAKVGKPWNEVHAEAVSRLDQAEPIFRIVARQEADRQDHVRIGESSYFSGLFVDDAGLLQKVAPALEASNLEPGCRCCTHTLNGVPFGKPYRG